MVKVHKILKSRQRILITDSYAGYSNKCLPICKTRTLQQKLYKYDFFYKDIFLAANETSINIIAEPI